MWMRSSRRRSRRTTNSPPLLWRSSRAILSENGEVMEVPNEQSAEDFTANPTLRRGNGHGPAPAGSDASSVCSGAVGQESSSQPDGLYLCSERHPHAGLDPGDGGRGL